MDNKLCFRNLYLLFYYQGPLCTSTPNSAEIGLSVFEISWFIWFLWWQLLSCWILETAKFYWLATLGRQRNIMMANFIKIGQSVADVSQFFNLFRMAATAVFHFRNRKILLADAVHRAETHHHAKFLSLPLCFWHRISSLPSSPVTFVYTLCLKKQHWCCTI